MTRENKLALIIGFGLILVVGILVSDHFSAAARRESADLVSAAAKDESSPLDSPRFLEQVEPVSNRASREPAPPPAPGLRPGPIAGNGTHVGLEPTDEAASQQGASERGTAVPDSIRLPDIQQRNAEERTRAPLPSDIRWYSIQPGESLAAIARREYGDEKLWRRLAELNADRIRDADIVPAGVTIRLPPRAELTGTAPSQTPSAAPDRASTPADRPAGPRFETYTFKSGDSLSKVAARLLGSGKKWNVLYELNRDVIRNPDNVPAGTTIRVPVND
jgi:nucleoid-associated protein YgaU